MRSSRTTQQYHFVSTERKLSQLAPDNLHASTELVSYSLSGLPAPSHYFGFNRLRQSFDLVLVGCNTSEKAQPLESLILTIRGGRVLIDADLATIYESRPVDLTKP